MKISNPSPPALELQSISKIYHVHHDKPTLVETILGGKNETFYALRDIHLTIRRGERVGIVGANGSGKTTLLKLMAGVTLPTAGSMRISGKIASIISLGAGFNLELSGIDNIFLDGMLLGMTRREISARLADIVAFSGIGAFIDAPMRTYSQGMLMRLGFSVALHTHPDIFLLDEGFDAGDQQFKNKLRTEATSLFRDKTLVLISHNMYAIADFCNRIVLIDKGRITYDGGIEGILKYDKSIKKEFFIYLKVKGRKDHLKTLNKYKRNF